LRKPFSLFEKGASLSIDRCKQNPNLKDNVKYQDTKSMRLHIMNSINKLEPRRYLPLLKNLVILKTHLLVLTIISSKLGRLFLSQNKIDFRLLRYNINTNSVTKWNGQCFSFNLFTISEVYNVIYSTCVQSY